ncbi:MAG: hypothetical protein ACD_58C00094G0002 [uncultured bacterium]|nr:MAG: hypothetical protein ACD_58C00094G0002 [uncultured bacterium]
MYNFLKLNKRKVVIIVVGLLLVGLSIWLWVGRVDAKIISEEATIKRVVYASEKSENAYLSLSFLTDSQKYLYANAMVDLNKDGNFAAYQINGKTQEEWVTKNMNTRTFANEGATFDFKLVDFNAETRQDFPVKIVLTAQELKSWDGKKIRNSAFQSMTIKSIEKDDISILYSPNPDRDGGLLSGFSNSIAYAQDEEIPDRPPVVDELSSDQEGTEATVIIDDADSQSVITKEKEKTVKTLGREFNVFHRDVPDISQGKNECAIMSTANSLLWLAKENKFTDKMPKSDGELISELKTDLKWDEGGVDTKKDYLDGKKAFTARHGILLETHMVNVMEYDINIVAKIAQELDKGQDVEISLAYWKKKADGSWEKTSGHMVTAVGATGNADGTQTLDIHDPLSPGPSKLDIYKVDGTKVIDYKYGANQVTYIRAAIAESPITPPAEPLIDSSTPTDSAITTTPPTTPTVATTTSPSTTSTPTTTPTATSSPTTTSDTSTPEEPTFSGLYESGTTESTSYLNLMATPTNLASQNFYGMQIDLGEQNPVMTNPDSVMSNVNLEGWNETDWVCSINGAIVRCCGSKPMLVNTKSIVTLYYPLPFNFNLPDPIIVYILDVKGVAKYRVVVRKQ